MNVYLLYVLYSCNDQVSLALGFEGCASQLALGFRVNWARYGNRSLSWCFDEYLLKMSSSCTEQKSTNTRKQFMKSTLDIRIILCQLVVFDPKAFCTRKEWHFLSMLLCLCLSLSWRTFITCFLNRLHWWYNIYINTMPLITLSPIYRDSLMHLYQGGIVHKMLPVTCKLRSNGMLQNKMNKYIMKKKRVSYGYC